MLFQARKLLLSAKRRILVTVAAPANSRGRPGPPWATKDRTIVSCQPQPRNVRYGQMCSAQWQVHQAMDDSVPILSPREKRLLRRIANGKSDHQIAVEIGGTERQVSEQRRRLLSKLDLQSEESIAAVAMRLAPWAPRSTRAS